MVPKIILVSFTWGLFATGRVINFNKNVTNLTFFGRKLDACVLKVGDWFAALGRNGKGYHRFYMKIIPLPPIHQPTVIFYLTGCQVIQYF